ncbi:MAG: hypothetical protein LC799_35175 [Actinobacteria bacterium]|nr:hypothetical protein [Actinomycetota bacterium]
MVFPRGVVPAGAGTAPARATNRAGTLEMAAAGSANDAALRLVHLSPLMERTAGSADVVIGLIDGPVVLDHPDLPGDNMREVPGARSAACGRTDTAACSHGTAVAGILSARRGPRPRR